MQLFTKITLSLVVAGFVAGLYVYFFVYNKPHPDIEKASPDFVVDAQSLFDEFTNTPEIASGRYNGKVLEVEGVLSLIEESDDMVILVFALSEGLFGLEGIRFVLLPNQAEKAKSKLRSDSLRVKGLCTGFTDSDVIIEQASIL